MNNDQNINLRGKTWETATAKLFENATGNHPPTGNAHHPLWLINLSKIETLYGKSSFQQGVVLKEVAFL